MQMSHKDLGFIQVRPELVHDATLTELERACLDTLGIWGQRDPSRRPYMPADRLAGLLGICDRSLRDLVNHLISPKYHGQALVPRPGPGGGYKLATTGEEAQRAAHTHWQRALTGVRKARALGAKIEELAQGTVQLTLGLGGTGARQVYERLEQELDLAGVPASHGAVARTLAVYRGDPQRYAQEIEDLARQFGGLFVRAQDLRRALEEASRETAERALARLTAGSQEAA